MIYTQEEILCDLHQISAAIDIALHASKTELPSQYRSNNMLGQRKANIIATHPKVSAIAARPKTSTIAAQPRNSTIRSHRLIARKTHSQKRQSTNTSCLLQGNSKINQLPQEDIRITNLQNSLINIQDQIGALTEKIAMHDTKSSESFDLLLNTIGAEFQKTKRENIELFTLLSELKVLYDSKNPDSIKEWLLSNVVSIVGLLLQIYTMLPTPPQ